MMRIKNVVLKKLLEREGVYVSIQSMFAFASKYIFNVNRMRLNLSLILMLLFIANSTSVLAQSNNRSAYSSLNKKINGIVIDANTEETIIGATILLLESKSSDNPDNQQKSNTYGVVSGLDGDFTFKVNPERAKFIKVSYVGYIPQEIEIDYSGKLMKISLLHDLTSLDEVVIMGYTTTTKEKSTGSTSTIKGNIITNSPTDNPIAALQGRLPGVAITQSSGVPGSKLNIMIRGKSTFDSSSEPLIIIDGMPFYNTSISSFNRGVVGDVDPLSSINPSDIERIDVLKDADATAIYGSRGANGVILITTKKGSEGTTKISVDVERGFSIVPKTMEFLNTEEYLKMRKDAYARDNEVVPGGVVPNNTVAADLLLWDQDAYTDWQDVLVGNTAKTINLQTSVSGGNKYTQFMISGGFNNSGSVILNDETDRYQRINGRFSISHMTKDEKFKLNGAMSYSSVLTDNKGNSPMDHLKTAPNRPHYDDEGKVYWSPSDDSEYRAPLQGTLADTENKVGTFMGTLSLGYEFIDDLIAKVDMGYSRTNSSQIHKYMDGYKNPDHNTSGYLNGAYMGESHQDLFNFEPQLTYSYKHGEGRVTALAGMTFQSLYNHDMNLELEGFVNPDLMDNAASADLLKYARTTSSEYRFASIFSRVGYEWKSRYFVNGVFRRDGSSRFYVGNRYGNFWSIGSAWIFSKEDIFNDESGIFSFGKIRASYGKTGNDGVGNYKYMATYQASRYRYNKLLGYYPVRLGNNDFSWEENKKFEVGLELAFFNKIISVDANYYNNRSDNQLVEYPLSQQTGFEYYQANLDALVVNSGIEISIMSKNINHNDFVWNTNFNITIPKNELLEFPDLDRSAYKTEYAIGKPLTTEWVYEFDKIDRETGVPLMIDQNDDDIINDQDRVFKGNSEPDFYGGIGNTLSYKGFELDIFFQFSHQPEAFGYLWEHYESVGTLWNVPKEMATDYWTPENKDATRPGLSSTSGTDIYKAYGSQYSESDAAFTSASFLRLKNLAFSYTLPNDWTQKVSLNSVKLYVNAQNLWTYTNFFGWDPETQLGEIPPLRTVTFGISVRL